MYLIHALQKIGHSFLCLIQEMDLLNAAYDGDIQSLNCALDAKVPVDVVTQVRDSSSCLRTECK